MNFKYKKIKKLLFVAALGVAGLVSAKNSIEEPKNYKVDANQIEESFDKLKSIEKSEVKVLDEKQIKAMKALRDVSFTVTFSCGMTINYSVQDDVPLSALLALIWFHDSIVCQ